jgi:hypothetical protein
MALLASQPHGCTCDVDDAHQSGVRDALYHGWRFSGGDRFSELASWVANAATDRPVFGSRFNTGNEEAALLARGFQYGTAPNAVVIGWNCGHTAVTLPDGTSVSRGERGGVHIGGPGTYQAGFTHHMFLPMPPEGDVAPPPPDAQPVLVDAAAPAPPAPPAPDAPPPGDPAIPNP